MQKSNTKTQQQESSIHIPNRFDVCYKTIIRDMRKYFKQDFNDNTLFVKRKRSKRRAFYFEQLQIYLLEKYHEFENELLFIKSFEDEDFSQVSENQLICFLASFLYQKEYISAIKMNPHTSVSQIIKNELQSENYGKYLNNFSQRSKNDKLAKINQSELRQSEYQPIQ
eukprot:403333164